MIERHRNENTGKSESKTLAYLAGVTNIFSRDGICQVGNMPVL